MYNVHHRGHVLELVRSLPFAEEPSAIVPECGRFTTWRDDLAVDVLTIDEDLMSSASRWG